MQQPINQNILKLANSQAWQIKDKFFNSILADSSKYTDIMDAINDLQNDYAGYVVAVKVGQLDKNGNISNNAKILEIQIPQNTEEIIQFINQPNAQQQQMYYTGLNGVEQKISTGNPNEVIKQIAELEKRLNDKFEVQLQKAKLDIETEYRLKEIERKEKEIRQKEQLLQKQINEYKEKNEKFFPAAKDVLNGVGNIAMELIGKKGQNLSGSPEKKEEKESFKFKIKDTEGSELPIKQVSKIDKLKDLFENLTEEEQNKFLDEYIEDTEEIEEQTETEQTEAEQIKTGNQ